MIWIEHFGFQQRFFADEGGSFVDIHLYYTGCPISVCAIWKIDLILSRYIGIYFVLIRPPSCMAVSRSYPWHLIKCIINSLFFLRIFLKRCNFILLTSLFFILKRPNFFSLESSLLHLDRNPRWSGYLCFYPPNYPADICSVIHPVIWSFPVWLSISLSYLMTVFSANLFGLFYGENFYRSDIACKELSCVRVYSEMGHLVYMYFK